MPNTTVPAAATGLPEDTDARRGRRGKSNVISLTAVSRARLRAVKEPHPADDLSFMQRRTPKGSGINYWLVTPSGSYSQDCETGEKLAKEYLAYIGRHPTWGNRTLLTCIVHNMMEQASAGQGWSGVHVGFLSIVNAYAMVAAHEYVYSLNGGAA